MENLRKRLPRPLWRALIAVAGGGVLLAGLVMIPYPGPGWAIVFVGLAILAQEFAWAHRWLVYGRRKFNAWQTWVKRQHLGVRIALVALTGVVVVGTIWLLNGYGLINHWLHLGWPWLDSPLILK